MFEDPSSLDAAALIPQLAEAGVAALKIEGRQRSRAYTEAVVRSFRKAVDAHAAGRPIAGRRFARPDRRPTNHVRRPIGKLGDRQRRIGRSPRQASALTVGPLQFNWRADAFSDFYARIADEAPVDRVVIGELVCSKRSPFYEDRIPAAIERLQRAGKSVVLGSLALVTLERERRAARELFDRPGMEVEINDLTLMNSVDERAPFPIGPLVNVYNEGTLAFLARKGATLHLPAAGTAFRLGRDSGGGRTRKRRRGRSLGLWPHASGDFGALLPRARARLDQGFLPVRVRARTRTA